MAVTRTEIPVKHWCKIISPKTPFNEIPMYSWKCIDVIRRALLISFSDSAKMLMPWWLEWALNQKINRQHTADHWCSTKRSITNCASQLTRLLTELYSDSFHAVLTLSNGPAICLCCIKQQRLLLTIDLMEHRNFQEKRNSFHDRFTHKNS